MKPKRILMTCAVLLAIAGIFAFVTHYYIDGNTPDVIQEIERTSHSSARLDNAIGGYQGFTSTWNEHDMEKDTLPFSITVLGSKRSVEYKGTAKKMNSEHWSIIRIDTLYHDN